MARVGGVSFLVSADSTELTGDPSSILLGMYALYVSTNADCSNYTTLVDHGTTVDYEDVATSRTLKGTPAFR